MHLKEALLRKTAEPRKERVRQYLRKTAACGDDGMHYCKSCEKQHEGMTCDCGESCDCADGMGKEASDRKQAIRDMLRKEAGGMAATAKPAKPEQDTSRKMSPAPTPAEVKAGPKAMKKPNAKWWQYLFRQPGKKIKPVTTAGGAGQDLLAQR